MGTAVVICVWQIWSFHGVRQDDPFITYRYGQNLANGKGLVFNPGVRFLGATSPAHMFLAALVYYAFGADLMPSIMAAVGCLAWTAQALVTFALLLPTLGAVGAWIVALVIHIGGAESFKWVPFETNIAMAFGLLALLVGRKGPLSLAGALFAVATLFRPELALLAAIFFCSHALQRPAAAIRAATTFTLLVGGWATFAIIYYGSALPYSAVQKFQRTTRSDYLKHIWTHLGEVLLPFGQGYWPSLCAWSLCVFGAIALANQCRTLVLLALFTFVHLLTFGLFLRPFVEHTWHLYPSTLGSVVFAVAGLSWASCRTSWWRLARAGAGLTLCGLIIVASVRSFRASTEASDAGWESARVSVYRDVAPFLREYLRPDEEFAAVEVGTLAFYSERAAYDLGGLVTDFGSDPMVNHPVRLLVLDKRHLYTAPPLPPIRVFSKAGFSAFVYEMPLYDREKQRYRTAIEDR